MTSTPKKVKIPYDLCLVWWQDHYTQDEWTEKRNMPTAPEVCLSVGWLVRDADDHVLLAPCIDPSDPDDGVMGGTWFILKNCITDRKVLRKGHVKKA